MKISPAAELAVRGVLAVAEGRGRAPVTLNSICNSRNLPKQYLTKIFATLARADIITPIRGKHGGYMLAREPERISLLDVIEAIEGPLALNFCQHDPPRCDRRDCLVRPVWTRLQAIFREQFSRMMLSDCMTTGA